MKTRKRIVNSLALTFSAVVAILPLSAHGQVYSFSAPLAAKCQLAVMDWSSNPRPVGSASWINLNTITEAVYYDPIAQTIRQVGSVSLNSPSDVTLSFNDVQVVDGNPQSAAVTVDFSLPSVLSFDSGVQPINGANIQFVPPSIPLTGSYSILAGGQTLTGSFGYSLDFQTSLTEISDATQTSLMISQSPSFYSFYAPDIARGVTAANGMVFNVVGGISDGTYSSSWSLSPVTATVTPLICVPEPRSSQLFCLGLIALGGLGAFRCRTQGRGTHVICARMQSKGQARGGR